MKEIELIPDKGVVCEVCVTENKTVESLSSVSFTSGVFVVLTMKNIVAPVRSIATSSSSVIVIGVVNLSHLATCRFIPVISKY